MVYIPLEIILRHDQIAAYETWYTNEVEPFVDHQISSGAWDPEEGNLGGSSGIVWHLEPGSIATEIMVTAFKGWNKLQGPHPTLNLTINDDGDLEGVSK